VKLGPARPHEPCGVGQTERDEQQSRLIHVAVVTVDHRDPSRIAVLPSQTVRGERASGTTTKDDDPRTHDPSVHRARCAAIRATAHVLRNASGRCYEFITVRQVVFDLKPAATQDAENALHEAAHHHDLGHGVAA
jgi:hypothetical protein